MSQQQGELSTGAEAGATSPATARLLATADEVLGISKALGAEGRHADALACALFANEYVRAAREEMHGARDNRRVG